MQRQDGHRSGWNFVATSEAAAALIDAAVELDPEETVTRSELAGMTDVTLKRLYLDETISDLVDVGVFEATDDGDDGQIRYAVNGDSDVLAAAEQFDRTFSERLAD
ncbi:hypothetical protein [Halorhabdus rudnickae]|uniref:hypothetical protein n=1 Tax=Halorhabdus rudnickae TaxID=1775544 RepID=UPI0010845F32|nr:hypothetical protein [Halorhabdus rudnickae]